MKIKKRKAYCHDCHLFSFLNILLFTVLVTKFDKLKKKKESKTENHF